MAIRGRSRGELKRGPVIGLIALAAMLALWLAPRAHADLYWAGFNNANGTSVGKAQTDGTIIANPFVTGAAGACGVVSDSTYVYWTQWTFGGTPHIGRVGVDGSNPDPNFVALPFGTSPCGVAVGGGFIYWTNTQHGAGTTLGRVAEDGVTGFDPGFVTGAAGPCGVAVTQTHIYWANNGGDSIGRVELDGVTGKDPNYVTGATDPCGVAVDDNYIYWANSFSGTGVGRVALDGVTGKDANFIPTSGANCGVAVNSQYIFWGEMAAGHVGRADIDGTNPNFAIVDSDDGPCGVALDAPPIPVNPVNPPGPSNDFKIKKVRKKRKKGIAVLIVQVPGAGDLSVNGKQVRGANTRTGPQPGDSRLRVKARGKKARALRRKGWARAKLVLKFTPDGGTQAERRATVVLVRKP